MSPPCFSMPAVWREPSSLQTPGNLGEGELAQPQCRYYIQDNQQKKWQKWRLHLLKNTEVSVPIHMRLPASLDCTEHSLQTSLDTGLLHQALRKLLWCCCQCLFQSCSTVCTHTANSFPIQVQTQPVSVSV